jgi:hypothetical protein
VISLFLLFSISLVSFYLSFSLLLSLSLFHFFYCFSGGGRKAAKVLKSANIELSIELEELADELAETHEKFGKWVKVGKLTSHCIA